MSLKFVREKGTIGGYYKKLGDVDRKNQEREIHSEFSTIDC